MSRLRNRKRAYDQIIRRFVGELLRPITPIKIGEGSSGFPVPLGEVVGFRAASIAEVDLVVFLVGAHSVNEGDG